MTKALITGIDGFVGGHLAALLLAGADIKLAGTTFLPTSNHQSLMDLGVTLFQVDLKDPSAVEQLFYEVQPDQIYHLAAQSFVPTSFENPWGTIENNIRGELNILHLLATKRLNARILVVGSSEEYGYISPEDLPIDEDQPLRPASPYSVSKVAQDLLGYQYFVTHGVQAIRVRPFNHTGPGQGKQFAAPAFASQVAAIERGFQANVLKVGNLEGERDISDVRDVVRAYEMLMAHGAPGEVYNIGQDRAIKVRTILDTLLKLSTTNIEVQVDPSRFRPVEVPVIVCNSRKLREATGWKPTISLDQTLTDILNFWRQQPVEAF